MIGNQVPVSRQHSLGRPEVNYFHVIIAIYHYRLVK